MINIEQNQKIAENENLRVASPTGSYEDHALIEFYNESDPNTILGAFAAQYIKYGGIVYKFNETEDLGREILKIDPDSTHTAASFVRMQEELKKQLNQGNLEPESLNQVLETEQTNMENEMNNTEDNLTGEVLGSEDTSTTTPPVIVETPLEGVTTSTPEAVFPENSTSTSTEEVVDPGITEPTSLEAEATSTASDIVSYAKKQIKKKITSKIKKKILT